MIEQEKFDKQAQRMSRLLNVTVEVKKSKRVSRFTNPLSDTDISNEFIFVKHDIGFDQLDINSDYYVVEPFETSGNVYYDIYRQLLETEAPQTVLSVIDKVGFLNGELDEDAKVCDEDKNALLNAFYAFQDVKAFVDHVCIHYDVYYYVKDNGEKVLSFYKDNDDGYVGKLVGSLVCTWFYGMLMNGDSGLQNGVYRRFHYIIRELAEYQLKRCNEYLNNRFVDLIVKDKDTGKPSKFNIQYPIIESDVGVMIDRVKGLGMRFKYKDIPFLKKYINKIAKKVSEYIEAHGIKVGRSGRPERVVTMYLSEHLNAELRDILSSKTGKDYANLITLVHGEPNKFSEEFIEAIETGICSWKDVRDIVKNVDFINHVTEDCERGIEAAYPKK